MYRTQGGKNNINLKSSALIELSASSNFWEKSEYTSSACVSFMVVKPLFGDAQGRNAANNLSTWTHISLPNRVEK